MHYYERNIVEIRNEYTDFFINMVSPLVFEGMSSIYGRSLELELQYNEVSKKNVSIKNPGVLKIFQHFLKGIPNLNINLIESEMIRIRDTSKNADIFEKLIRSVFKSNIILLTYNASGKECKLVNEKFHEKIDIKTFIHKIYIECAIQFFNYPELFWHKYSTNELQKNKREAINIIKECIREAILKVLPLNDILVEYLKNDYIQNQDEEASHKVRQLLLDEDKHINLYDEEKPILENDGGMEEAESNKLFRDLNKNMTNMDDLILNKKSDNHSYHSHEEHFSNNNNNTDEEFKNRLNKDGYTFDLLNKNKNKNVNKENHTPPYNKQDNRIEENSDHFEISKPKLEEEKINKINPKEYFNTMFM